MFTSEDSETIKEVTVLVLMERTSPADALVVQLRYYGETGCRVYVSDPLGEEEVQVPGGSELDYFTHPYALAFENRNPWFRVPSAGTDAEDASWLNTEEMAAA